MSSRVTHADRTAPRIERRKSCPRRSHRRCRRGGPHSGKKAERTSSTGAKTRREWNREKTASAPEFLPRPLHLFFSLLPETAGSPFFLFAFARYLAPRDDDMHMRRARRERERKPAGSSGARMDPENRYGQARAHPSIALPDYRLEQKKCRQTGRLVALCPPMGCVELRPASLLIYSRVSTRSCGNGGSKKRKKKRDWQGSDENTG